MPTDTKCKTTLLCLSSSSPKRSRKTEPENFVKRNIGIVNGRIVEVSEANIKGKERINADGLFIYPGFIDAHCHFLEYGIQKQKINLEKDSKITKYVKIFNRQIILQYLKFQ